MMRSLSSVCAAAAVAALAGWAGASAETSCADPDASCGRLVGETPDLGVFKECDVCPEMVVVPAGVFDMGSPEDEERRGDDEGPVHRVSVPRFALARVEVTFAQWDACVADGGCGGYRPDDKGRGRGRHPASGVSWEDAQAFLAWINGRVAGAPYRLPSEAEWEYAARGGTTTVYSWGDDEAEGCVHANGKDRAGMRAQGLSWTEPFACDDGFVHAAPVGSLRPNRFGLSDMAGNVWELVQDCYEDDYEGAPSDGSARGAGSCWHVVIRGGSWINGPAGLRAAQRSFEKFDGRASAVGFRVARSLRR